MLKKIFIACIATVVFILASCDKNDIHEIGLGILPNSQNLEVNRIDTVSIRTYSVLQDSIRADETFTSILGSSYDPVFGITDASIYTALSLTSSSFSFGDNPVADSAYAMFDYSASYGDTTTVLTLHINRLTEKIEKDSVYYSNRTFASDESVDYANGFQFTPRPNDSVYIDTILRKAHLKVPLDISFGEFLVSASDDVMESSDEFYEFFNGLHIYTDRITTQGQGSLLSFGLTASLTNFRVYFHNDTDTSFVDYQIYATTPRVAHFEHDNYNTASETFKQQVIQGDTMMGQQQVYCQSMAGVRTLVKFPYIDELRDRNIVINNAYLYLSVQDDEMYPPISTISLNIKEGETIYSYLSDDLESDNYFGGMYDDDTHEYRFRVTKYMQQLLNDPEKSNTLIIQTPGGSDNPKRVVFNGPEAEGNKIRLEIIYTKVD